MSTADKYPGPWKISASWGGGPEVLNVRDANGTWIATVTRDLAPAFCAMNELIEACETFVEWLRREDAGWKGQRDTPDGEAAWRAWYYENLRICQLAQDRARAALAKARGEG